MPLYECFYFADDDKSESFYIELKNYDTNSKVKSYITTSSVPLYDVNLSVIGKLMTEDTFISYPDTQSDIVNRIYTFFFDKYNIINVQYNFIQDINGKYFKDPFTAPITSCTGINQGKQGLMELYPVNDERYIRYIKLNVNST